MHTVVMADVTVHSIGKARSGVCCAENTRGNIMTNKDLSPPHNPNVCDITCSNNIYIAFVIKMSIYYYIHELRETTITWSSFSFSTNIKLLSVACNPRMSPADWTVTTYCVAVFPFTPSSG